MMWTMQQILFMSFDRRLAVFLIDESAKTGKDTLTMTHDQIANIREARVRLFHGCLNILKMKVWWSWAGAGSG